MFWFQIICVKGNTVLVNEQRDVFGLKRLHLHLPGFQNGLKTLKDCKSAPTSLEALTPSRPQHGSPVARFSCRSTLLGLIIAKHCHTLPIAARVWVFFDYVLLELQKGFVSGRDARFKTEIYPVGELLDASGFLWGRCVIQVRTMSQGSWSRFESLKIFLCVITMPCML